MPRVNPNNPAGRPATVTPLLLAALPTVRGAGGKWVKLPRTWASRSGATSAMTRLTAEPGAAGFEFRTRSYPASEGGGSELWARFKGDRE